MNSNQIVFFFILAYISVEVMSKKVAGLIVFRRTSDTIEYLLLKPRSKKKEWSPPKGIFDLFD